MFKTFQEYEAAAMALLQDKPKGTGFKNATGVVLLVSDELCYVEEGDGLDACGSIDASCWDDCTNAAEFVAVLNPVFVERFTPAEIVAYEASDNEPAVGRILNKSQAEAVYSAMCAMRRADGNADTMSFSQAIVRADRHGAISICGSRVIDDEHYAALADFAAAYGLQEADKDSADFASWSCS